MILAKPAAFYATIREKEFDGFLLESQVQGIEVLIGAIPLTWDLRWAAYLLATAFWETNRTMQPVREAYWLNEAWRKAHLRYYPWYGRGFCQLTWQANYEVFSRVTGRDLVGNPDLALDPTIAAQVIVFGMANGSFTGVALGNYLNSNETDWAGARRVINGSDHAEAIGEMAKVFYSALIQ